MASENQEREFPLMRAEDRAVALSSETSMWLNVAKFEQGQRIAKLLADSDFVPTAFRGKIGNCMIALNLAERMRSDPLMIMQTMYVVHGRPGFEGKLLSALVNNSGRYQGKLKYDWRSEKGKPDWGCRAWAVLKGTDERVNGPWVDWAMVVAEGWNKPKGGNKPGSAPQPSKWMTIPEVMFYYRAATFFCRIHDSDLLMGMSTVEELEDTSHTLIQGPSGTWSTGTDAERPANIYDVTHQAPPPVNKNINTDTQEKGPETNGSDHVQADGNSCSDSAAGPGDSSGPAETSEAPTNEKQGSESEIGTPKLSEHQLDAVRFCRDEEIRKLYKGLTKTYVEIAAAALGVPIDQKDYAATHQAVKDMAGPSDESETDQGEQQVDDHSEETGFFPGADDDTGQQDQSAYIDLLDQFNVIFSEAQKNPDKLMPIFKAAVNAANIPTGQRPADEMQARIFVSSYNNLRTSDSQAAGLSKGAVVEEETPEDIWNKSHEFMAANYPQINNQMFRNFLVIRSAQSGVPAHELAKQAYTSDEHCRSTMTAFSKWKNMDKF